MHNELRRVVVTGIGLVTPLGVGVKHVWPRLLAGKSGISSTKALADPIFAELPSRVAGIVPHGHLHDGAWDPDDHLTASEQRQTALFSQYAIAAAEEALQDSAIVPTLSQRDKESTGVVIGSGIGNLEDQHDTSVRFAQGGHKKTHPLFVPRLLINMAAGHVAMRYGLFGPNLAPTTACTTGLHALIHAAQLIEKPGLGLQGIHDTVDVVIAGASEACIHPLAISGFARARSLSTGYNETPERASRPFDSHRDGFVIGEGAGVVVLEERERALRRGANVYAELVGTGMSCDASHMTAPRSDGKGAQLAMDRALTGLTRKCMTGTPAMAHFGSNALAWSRNLIEYVNAHATGTRIGDAVESAAMRAVFQDKIKAHLSHHEETRAVPPTLAVNSTKGATGHLLGAAGAVEAVFTLLSMQSGGIPPTLNLETIGDAAKRTDNEQMKIPMDGYGLDYVRSHAVSMRPLAALTNSFGFGGTNASVCFTRFPGDDELPVSPIDPESGWFQDAMKRNFISAQVLHG